ncbi:MAG: hypothetical protein IH857_06290 [Deltaproteobacteria bacterium]|nr:hypothetical protein [Deltaproteobacteria bacterium]
MDEIGSYVFTAGGTSGVYGIRLRADVNRHLILGLLNSKPLDFYLKHTSAVYAGHSYSYGDQFLKLQPIKLPRTEPEREMAQRISGLARDLIQLKDELRSKEGTLAGFPATLLEARRRLTDIYTVRRLASGRPQAMRIRVTEASKDNRDGAWVLAFRRSVLEFPSEAHVDACVKWLQLQERDIVGLEDLLKVRLPKRADACRRLLSDLTALQESITRTKRNIDQKEEELNHLVSEYYQLDAEAHRVVENFLRRF